MTFLLACLSYINYLIFICSNQQKVVLKKAKSQALMSSACHHGHHGEVQFAHYFNDCASHSRRRSFHCIYILSMQFRCTAGPLASFVCALWHLSQLTAVHLPVVAIQLPRFRLINRSRAHRITGMGLKQGKSCGMVYFASRQKSSEKLVLGLLGPFQDTEARSAVPQTDRKSVV